MGFFRLTNTAYNILQLTPSLLGKHPNTYTFTKALTEQMLLEEAEFLPVTIVRPSAGILSHNISVLLHS